MIVYLAISLTICRCAMNIYNRTVQLREDKARPGCQPARCCPSQVSTLDSGSRASAASAEASVGRRCARVSSRVRLLHRSLRRSRSTVIVSAIRRLICVRRASGSCKWAVINAIWTLPPGAGSTACRAVAGRRRVLGGRDRSAFASSCSAPIRSISSGGRRSPVCCSWRSTRRALYVPGGRCWLLRSGSSCPPLPSSCSRRRSGAAERSEPTSGAACR